MNVRAAVDLPAPTSPGSSQVVETMRADGLAPCVVLQTSPGNLQVWLRVSTTHLEPAVASSIGKHLAQRYGGKIIARKAALARWRG